MLVSLLLLLLLLLALALLSQCILHHLLTTCQGSSFDFFHSAMSLYFVGSDGFTG
jgi:hypothetical protein